MQPRAHPFFSGIGCGAALLLALGLSAILYFRGGGPFNPGPLSAASTSATAGNATSDFASHADFEADCGQCHAPWQGVTAGRCEACHTNVAEQRQTETGLHGLLPDTGRCRTCHTDHKGRDATITMIADDAFDHDVLTDFSLARHRTDYDGREIACAGCHGRGNYGAAQIDCVTCHTDAEPAFMAEHTDLFGTACLDCHDGVDRMAGFDHQQVFPLEGAHETVACARCHEDRTFQGTPQECAACHEEPAVHVGLFGLDCVRCHTTTAWTPAQLTQHTFPLDHGDEGKQACMVCHEQTYMEYTCYNCHEHDPAGTREEHIEEGITDFENCVECHPTGQKDEAEENERDGD